MFVKINVGWHDFVAEMSGAELEVFTRVATRLQNVRLEHNSDRGAYDYRVEHPAKAFANSIEVLVNPVLLPAIEPAPANPDQPE
jgi:hypothetical protein